MAIASGVGHVDLQQIAAMLFQIADQVDPDAGAHGLVDGLAPFPVGDSLQGIVSQLVVLDHQARARPPGLCGVRGRHHVGIADERPAGTRPGAAGRDFLQGVERLAAAGRRFPPPDAVVAMHRRAEARFLLEIFG
ncbi:MAG: hypothetical protein EOL90_06545 [Spartobacteria bacterium]|nr:hypothetical protein [Spartobacteria bacterium]